MADARGNEPEIEALLVDRYLESILLAREHGSRLAVHDPGLDPQLRVASDWLTAGLIRVHPSFRFEERLARRLADLAGAMRLPAAAGGGTSSPPATIAFAPGDRVDPARDVADEGDPFGRRARPLLIGGALTSAAVSLAGAAFVAWRLSRPVHPMVRAIRAAHDRSGHQGGLA
jgi:hypothetical protein